MPGAAFYCFAKNPSTIKIRSQFVSRPFLGITFSCSFLTYNLQELLLHPISSQLIFLILKFPNNSFLPFPPSPLWRRTLIITCMPRQLLQNQWKYLMLEAAWGNRLISQTATLYQKRIIQKVQQQDETPNDGVFTTFKDSQMTPSSPILNISRTLVLVIIRFLIQSPNVHG